MFASDDTCQVRYHIKPSDPYGHLFHVTLQIDQPASTGQQLRLPSWIPGSYMIRDFAKNILSIQAQCAGQALSLTQLDKQTWQVEPCTGCLEIHYDIYAWDLSVRAAHLDQTHAYFNGTSVFLEVVDQADQPCSLIISNADIAPAKDWKVGTSLATAGAELYGFGRYLADNYQDLIDHPVEIADFDCIQFEACGIPHDFILTGRHNADLPRLARDLTRICEHQINLFGQPAPFQRYVFITWAVGEGYGGLEHRASTSLICKRDDLPCINEADKVSDGYQTFLGLCSHEYFHSWNVKRIQPDIPYDLRQENHTPLLWAFEGITSYYDDLTLVRCGLISQSAYLKQVAQTITRVQRNPGRMLQSTAQSSFNAWTKFYKQDENAINAIVSYYTKGALIALALDLTLRTLSKGALTLDRVMVDLWQHYGQTGEPVAEYTIQNLCADKLLQCTQDQHAVTELNIFLDNAIYGTEDLDFYDLLQPFGIEFHLREAISMADLGGDEKEPSAQRVDLGISVTPDPSGAKITRVLSHSCGHQAGLSAGDVLIALDNIQLNASNLEARLRRYQPGDQVLIHGFRRDELMQFSITLAGPNLDTVYLTVKDQDKVSAWLGN